MERSYERLGAAYLDDLLKGNSLNQILILWKADPQVQYTEPLLVDITVGIDPQISVGPINRSERLINRASI